MQPTDLFPHEPHSIFGIAIRMKLLHQACEVKSHYSTWFKSRIVMFQLLQNVDYTDSNVIYLSLPTAMKMAASSQKHLPALDHLYQHYAQSTLSHLRELRQYLLAPDRVRNEVTGAFLSKYQQVQLDPLLSPQDKREQQAVLASAQEQAIKEGLRVQMVMVDKCNTLAQISNILKPFPPKGK